MRTPPIIHTDTGTAIIHRLTPTAIIGVVPLGQITTTGTVAQPGPATISTATAGITIAVASLNMLATIITTAASKCMPTTTIAMVIGNTPGVTIATVTATSHRNLLGITIATIMMAMPNSLTAVVAAVTSAAVRRSSPGAVVIAAISDNVTAVSAPAQVVNATSTPAVSLVGNSTAIDSAVAQASDLPIAIPILALSLVRAMAIVARPIWPMFRPG